MPYAITIFLSAFLLFMVQLIMGKLILPWFGGTPGVWTTCMLFFQVLLLIGYAYAHLIDRKLTPAGQARLHMGIVVGSGVLLAILYGAWGSPILPSDEWKPATDGTPALQILVLLGASIGLPFFVLSTTSPLLQRWYSLGVEGDKPYRLYALSNVGSMLGLLSYPFLVEPTLRLPTQGLVWTALYLVFAGATLICAKGLLRVHKSPFPVHERTEISASSSWGDVLIWLFLSMCTSAMLLAITNSLCQDVAVVPFLWVLPLVLYLLSFVICFDKPRWYRSHWFVPACMVATLMIMVTISQGLGVSIPVHVMCSSLFLFVFCMTLHGELVKLRPPARRLTLFYLTVASGGALGAVLVALVAPVVFEGYWELPIMLTLGWVLLMVVFARDKHSVFYTGSPAQLFILLFLLGCPVLFFLFRHSLLTSNLLIRQSPAYWSAVGAVTAAAAFCWLLRGGAFVRLKYWPRLCGAVLVCALGWFAARQIHGAEDGTLAVDRNFYGVVRVQELSGGSGLPPHRQLVHGRINHGIQFIDPELRRRVVSYYSRSSGINLAFQHHARRRGPGAGNPMNIGVLGLGVGTVAAFAHENDVVRFYEINPAVIDYARGGSALFSYLDESPGEVGVVLGDARLSLERELAASGPAEFDVLVMDAFSSDSVPVHLLTAEAFELYLKHMRDERSIIAVNISNRFLNFEELISTVAERFEMELVIVAAWGDMPEATPSLWALLTRDREFVGLEGVAKHWRQPRAGKGREILWTDQFSNLFQLLK